MKNTQRYTKLLYNNCSSNRYNIDYVINTWITENDYILVSASIASYHTDRDQYGEVALIVYEKKENE